MTSDVIQVIVSMGIPSAFTSFVVWLLKRYIDKRGEEDRKEREERQRHNDEIEASRREFEKYILKDLSACTTLAFATARAVQRIPDAKCNGDMVQALREAEAVRGDYREFLNDRAIEHIFERGA